MSTTKKAAQKKAAAAKKTAPKKVAKITGTKKNKLGVKNSLVNNINARKKKGKARSKKDSTVSKESYDAMEHHWDKDKK